MPTPLRHLSPQDAWTFLQAQPAAVLIDVRMEIESLYVGRPPGAINIAWYEYPSLQPDPNAFVLAVERTAGSRTTPVLLICRSGARTLEAGQALIDAGFAQVYNILEGFEGELDAQHHRSTLNGWRYRGLPWEQM